MEIISIVKNPSEKDIQSLVLETGASSDAISQQLKKLSGYGVPTEDAKRTIRELYGEDGNSIFNLRGVGSLRGHFLLTNGFDSVEKIAQAPEEQLREVRYLGKESVPVIQESAQSKTANSYGPKKSASRAQNSPNYSRQSQSTASVSKEPAIEGDVYPESFKARDQWILWIKDNRGKFPTAPWQTGHLGRVDATEPSNWTSFGEVNVWANKMPRELGLGFVLTKDDPFLFIDYDDVRDESGEISERVRRHLERVNSYSSVSTSGSGVHVYTIATLSDNVNSIDASLDKGSMEIYEERRFIALTGRHLKETPSKIRFGQRIVEALEAYFGEDSTSKPDNSDLPQTPDVAFAEIESTSDIDVIFSAIRDVSPGDIRLRSEKTESRSDGSISYDPCWVDSESGTRLAALENFWLYRKGMYVLDALQVVALEEGIIQSITGYPSGEEFWTAIEKLRERGAHIPEYERSSQSHSE